MGAEERRRVLVGIPVLDNLEMTRVCLRHMFAHTPADSAGLTVDFLVLDNGSSDDILAMLRADFGAGPFGLHYRRNPRNLGVAIAWNQILAFSPHPLPPAGFAYDFYVIANNDAFVGPGWLQALLAAMDSDPRVGWVSCLENGSPLLPELIEAHAASRRYRVDPARPYDSEAIEASLQAIYAPWGGHAAFCAMVARRGLPVFAPFEKEKRSAVCFMLRPAMVAELGWFDEDNWPVGIAEDLEYFLRIDGVFPARGWTPVTGPWRAGFAGGAVVHHNWCSTHQGRNFDGRRWDKQREKFWKKKFGRSKKYFTRLLR